MQIVNKSDRKINQTVSDDMHNRCVEVRVTKENQKLFFQVRKYLSKCTHSIFFPPKPQHVTIIQN